MGSDGAIHWSVATGLWLCANPASSDAIHEGADGRGQLWEDTALLRVVPEPRQSLRLTGRRALVGEPVWMAGFPLRTARSAKARAEIGYDDADGSLRISCGQVLSVDAQGCFSTDLDGSMGNSGSPVFDAEGEVIGMFSRITGDGPRSAFEYGHVQRVHVPSAWMLRLLPDGR